MAFPFTVDFEGVGGVENVSFLSALTRGTDEGKPVKMSSNGTVALAGDGDQWIGVVSAIDNADKLATVQLKGFCTLNYTGTKPTVGIGTLVGNGAGGVKGTANALGKKLYQVVSATGDNTSGTCVVLLG